MDPGDKGNEDLQGTVAQISTSPPASGGGNPRSSVAGRAGSMGGISTRQFGVSLVELTLASAGPRGGLYEGEEGEGEEEEEHVTRSGKHAKLYPRILVFMCEYLINYVQELSTESTGSQQQLESEVRLMLTQSPPQKQYEQMKQRLSQGDFSGTFSPICMFRLLRAFVRELPESLIPSTFYQDAIDMVIGHVHLSVERIRDAPRYKAMLSGFPTALGDELDKWVSQMWDVSTKGALTVSEHLVAEVTAFHNVFNRVAFSIQSDFSLIEEIFFKLPQVHRDCLEYLVLSFVKLDLIVKRFSTAAVVHEDYSSVILQDLAALFAPYIMCPVAWMSKTPSERLRTRVFQQHFVFLFFMFIKRKHNYLTPTERLELEMDEDFLIDQLLLKAIPSSNRFNLALSLLEEVPRTSNEVIAGVQPRSPPSLFQEQSQATSSNAPGDIPRGVESGALSSSSSSFTKRKSQMQQLWLDSSATNPVHFPLPVRMNRKTSLPSRKTFSSSGDNSTFENPPANMHQGAQNFSALVAHHVECGRVNPFVEIRTNSELESKRKSHDFARELAKDVDKTGEGPSPFRAETAEMGEEMGLRQGEWDISETVEGEVVWLEWEWPKISTREEISSSEKLCGEFKLDENPYMKRWVLEPHLLFSPPSPSLPKRPVMSGSSSSLNRAESLGMGTVGDSVGDKYKPCPARGLQKLLFEKEYDKSKKEDRSVNRATSSGSISLQSVGLRKSSSFAANYDTVLSFPRSRVGTRDTGVTDIVTFFIEYPNKNVKAPYAYDKDQDFVNSRTPSKQSGDVCEHCSTKCSKLSLHRKVNCGYCGRVFCSDCCSKQMLLPHRLLEDANFKPGDVCQSCEHHLRMHFNSPVLEFTKFSNTAKTLLGEACMKNVLYNRRIIMKCIFFNFLNGCPSRAQMISMIPPRILPLISIYTHTPGPRISLGDLCALKRDISNFATDLDIISSLFSKHCGLCPSCVKLRIECCAGVICRHTGSGGDGNVFLSNESHISEIELCHSCGRYCHSPCFNILFSVCIACARKPSQNVKSLVEDDGGQEELRRASELNAHDADDLASSRSTERGADHSRGSFNDSADDKPSLWALADINHFS
eukprot:Nk52_evm6s148 gene=Nk52_evmTU6s148